MTTEEKARAYDEAIERARKWYSVNTNEGYRGIFEDIFPELAESEDEKIRKWLEETIEGMPENSIDFRDVRRIDVLHWLEKQGRQKPKWTEEDEKVFNNLIGSLIRISHHTFTDCTSPNYTFFTEIEWLKELKQRMEGNNNE